jgi:hypothetical protein
MLPSVATVYVKTLDNDGRVLNTLRRATGPTSCRGKAEAAISNLHRCGLLRRKDATNGLPAPRPPHNHAQTPSCLQGPRLFRGPPQKPFAPQTAKTAKTETRVQKKKGAHTLRHLIRSK